jgi:ATP-dependent DNA ligase
VHPPPPAPRCALPWSCPHRSCSVWRGALDTAIYRVDARRGKRAGLFGAYLLAVYSPESEEFQTISKIGTGFSEEVLKELSEKMRGHIIGAPRPYYR